MRGAVASVDRVGLLASTLLLCAACSSEQSVLSTLEGTPAAGSDGQGAGTTAGASWGGTGGRTGAGGSGANAGGGAGLPDEDVEIFSWWTSSPDREALQALGRSATAAHDLREAADTVCGAEGGKHCLPGPGQRQRMDAAPGGL